MVEKKKLENITYLPASDFANPWNAEYQNLCVNMLLRSSYRYDILPWRWRPEVINRQCFNKDSILFM